MPKVDYSVILHQPIDTVWAALTDFENTPQWQPAIIREWHPPPGPIQVGDHLHQIRTFRGRRVASTSAVKEYEPERRMVNASDPTVFPWVRTAYACEPSDEGTRLTFSIDLRGKGMFMLLSPLIRRVLHKDVVTRFATLETYLTTQRRGPDAPIIKSA